MKSLECRVKSYHNDIVESWCLQKCGRQLFLFKNTNHTNCTNIYLGGLRYSVNGLFCAIIAAKSCHDRTNQPKFCIKHKKIFALYLKILMESLSLQRE